MCAKVSPSPFPVFFFSSRFTSFFVVVVFVVVVFVVVLFCFFVFCLFSLSFGDLPPAGKLHRSGEEMHTRSYLFLRTTSPSTETNSYCKITSKTFTTIRSKYQLESG